MATNRPLQILLLLLALVPTAIVIVVAVYLLLAGETATFNWQSEIWPVGALQVLAIAAFWAHASTNKRLAPGEIGGWVLQVVVIIPFGMLSYWAKHVWGQPSGVRP
jgi:hypothetical protein